MKKWFAAFIAAALLAALPAAYAAGEEKDEKKTEPLTQEQLAELDCVGEQTEDALQIALTNDAGADITSVMVRVHGEEEWSDELMEKKDVFEDGETSLLCWTPGEDESTLALYDICLVMTDEEDEDSQVVLHMVPLSDMDAARLAQDEESGLYHLVYTSLLTEKEVDTLQTEQMAAEQDEKDEEQKGWSFTGSAGGESGTGGNTTGCVGDGALFY